MIVRCGRCGSEFDVVGAGRHRCPVCGTVNEVRAQPSPGDAPPAPRPPPPPETPSPRVTCSECGFSFIVGDVDDAPCPNCGNTVTVRTSGGES